MKLYTEEQLHNTVIAVSNYLDDINLGMAQEKIEKHLKSLQPIELPSDDEIKSYSDRYSTMHEDVSDKLGKYLVSAIHIDGANWMKEQIINQNK
jgi:hypothetical protein